MLLQGLFVPLTCPFYRDGASYLRKLEHNVARYSLGPAAGMAALAPGGEAGSLRDAEKAEFLKSVAAAAGAAKVLLTGVEAASVHAAMGTIEIAERLGFDAVLLGPPPDWARLVNGEDARELLLFYTAVADRSPLPIVLWSDARPPYLPLPDETVLQLAQHANIIGLVDADLTAERAGRLLAATANHRRRVTVTTIFEAATRRMLQASAAPQPVPSNLVSVESLSGGTAALTTAVAVVEKMPALKTREKEVAFQVLSAGPMAGLVALLRSGVAGAMPALAACAPQSCFEAYAAWKDGDYALAEERAGRLNAVEELVGQWGPAAVKAGCDYNGYFGGISRLPRLPLTADQRTALERAMGTVRS